jgi:hypothetical protein
MNFLKKLFGKKASKFDQEVELCLKQLLNIAGDQGSTIENLITSNQHLMKCCENLQNRVVFLEDEWLKKNAQAGPLPDSGVLN